MTDDMNFYELSPSQKRLWSLFKDGGINNQVHVVFEGAIDADALRQAFFKAAEGHDMLRVGFQRVSYLSFPLQHVRTAMPSLSAWTYVDLVSEQDPASPIHAYAHALSAKQYDWQKDSLFDVLFIKTSGAAHLILQLPAVCGDVYSCINIIKEAVRHYYKMELPGETPSFFQYAQWHNEVLKTAEEEDLAYWRERNAAERFDHRLPLEMGSVRLEDPSIVRIDGVGGIDGIGGIDGTGEIDGIGEIDGFIQRNSLSYEAFFLGIWQLCLLQYFEEGMEIGLGVAVDGRLYDAFRDICGPLSRTLPMVIKAGRETVVVEFLSAVQLQLSELKERQFAAPVPGLPSFPFCFEYVDAGLVNPAAQAGFYLQETHTRGERCRLKLFCMRTERNIGLQIEYSADVFSEEAISVIRHSFQNHITALLADNKATVGRLVRASPAEEALILDVFNTRGAAPEVSVPEVSATALSAPEGAAMEVSAQEVSATVLSLFDEQVRLHPDVICVEDDHRSLTYAALHRQADHLAGHLINAHHVRPGDIVAIRIPRSVEMIVGLIGIIKAGAAFLPIDPAWPEKRVSYILENSKAKLLLSEIPSFPSTAPDTVLPAVNPSRPLYVIYTSGSTGEPKGVVISNASFVNYITWFRDTFDIGVKDSTCLFSSIAYDLCYTALWSSLLSGARLVLLKESDYLEPALLIDKLIDHGITYIKLTPSHFHMLAADPDLVSNVKKYRLRLVVTGGEPIVVDDLERFFVQREDIVFVNHYGPTETTVGAIYCSIPGRQLPDFKRRPVIGNPIRHNKVYILDKDRRLSPVGVTGEIGIAGAGVGIGYLNNETLTREKFIPNPYMPGERLYLTGDMGRYMADGSIEFLGRRDHQVKIRGYRVELNEIARAASSFPGILEVEVAADKEKKDTPLIAFFTSSSPVDVHALKAHLAAALPVYMVPQVLMSIVRFPLTKNGKKDLPRLLSEFRQRRQDDVDGYTAPDNFLETRVAAIWQEVLGLQRMGVTDNFFSVGGHSLKAIQIISRVYKELHVRIQMRDIFEHPTIRGLAAKMASGGTVGFEAIASIPEAADYEVSNAQARLWTASRLETGTAIYNLPFTYFMEGEVDTASMEKALDAIVERHQMLRTTFHETDGRLRQRVHAHPSFSLRLKQVDLRSDPEKEALAGGLIKRTTSESFDLSKGPLVRALLVQMEEDLFVFVLVMHHIISDAWSMEILLGELITLYRGFRTGNASVLPPLRIQYKEYAVWHNRLVAGEGMIQHRNYWHNLFRTKAPALNFPTDRPRQRFKSFEGGIIELSFTSAQLYALRSVSEKYDATLFMTLLAMLNALLYRYTGVQDIVIGTPAAQREHPDLQDQVGLYLNSLALRTRFKGKDSFSDVLLKVREVVLDAYSHQVYPFDLLVSELDLKSDAGRQPLFDMVMLLNKEKRYEAADPASGGIHIKRIDPGIRVSTVDMRIVFTEAGDSLFCSVEYDAALFNAASITKFMEDFQVLTDQVTGDNDIRIYHLLTDTVTAESAAPEIKTAFNL